MGDAHPFASATLGRHLVRGLAGFGLVAAAFGLLGVVGPLSFALLPLGLLALRGCPMCWTLGLVELLSRGRLRRSCEDGQCRPVRPEM
jgi:hypothetical protein